MGITKKHILSWLLLSFVCLLQLSLIIPVLPARADEALFNQQTGITEVGQVFGDKKQDLRVTAVKIINVILTFLAIIFLALTVFAGFKYMTAAGNEEKAKQALSLLKDAIIGLVIILFAWSITRFLMIRFRAISENRVDYLYYNY